MLRLYNQQREQEKLEKKLSRVGTPLWYTTQSLRGLGKLAVMLYALNAGVQTMTLLQSEAYQSRERIAKNAYVIATDLREDETFQKGVETYLQAKALIKPELRTTINQLEQDIEVASKTQDEFINRVQKIYNPLAVIGMN
ncbi:MAG: hypothetical protein ACMXYD_05005 [Candidatus Woesearchaeota archaeon]